MSLESNKGLEEIESAIKEDAIKHGTRSRFGFFSIPFSAYLGDKYYGKSTRINKDANRKVVTDPRGIYTNPTKKGDMTDPYFIQAVSKQQIKDDIDSFKQATLAKVAKAKSKDRGAVKESFHPGGPQEYVDFFDHKDNKVNYEIPITKTIDKTKKIDKAKHSVFTEPRGVYTSPPKRGTSSFPNILFSTLKEEPAKVQPKQVTRIDKESLRNKTEAFKPASLKKNEAFHNDKAVYGEDEKNLKELINKTKETKYKGQIYKKQLPDGALKHMDQFYPAQLVKSGLNTLFQPIFGVPFISHEKKVVSVREKKELEKKSRKDPFMYNRLVDSTTFSPPVTSFLGNLKKEFPRVFHK